MKKSIFALGLGFFSLFTAPISSEAGVLVSGISGCIMKQGGVAGYTNAPYQQWSTIREPATGDYADFGRWEIFPNGSTMWATDISYNINYVFNKSGSEGAMMKVFWGALPRAAHLPQGDNYLFEPVAPGKYSFWVPAYTGNVESVKNSTESYGQDGWMYRRGTYRGGKVAISNPFYSVYNKYKTLYANVWGIYRTRDGYVTVPGNSVFEDCKSTSTTANGNWVSSSFVQAKELNEAFNLFETMMVSKISEKKLNLSLVSETSRVTESASSGKNISATSTGFSGVLRGLGAAKSAGSVSQDATSVKGSFQKY